MQLIAMLIAAVVVQDWEEKKLATLPSELASQGIGGDVHLAFRADGTAVAAASYAKGLFVDGKKAGDAAALLPRWSEDGKTLVYVEMKERVGRVVAGAKSWPIASPPYEGPLISKDGSRVAFVTRVTDQGRAVKDVVVNGDKTTEHEISSVDLVSALAMSPDGQHVAYVLLKMKPPAECVVLDGVEGEWYQEVGEPTFTPDNKLAYGALQMKTYTPVIVIGGEVKAQGKSESMAQRLCFGADGALQGYLAMGSSLKLVINGKTQKTEGLLDTATFGKDGAVAYRASKTGGGGRTAWIVVGGAKGEAFDGGVGRPVISPDGTKVAYWGRTKDKISMLAGGNRVDELDWAGDPVFSADGTKVAFGAAKGGELWWKVLAVK